MLRKSVFFLLFIFAIVVAHAQTVTIYRAGAALSPTYSTIKSAVFAAIDNDSLVLSADVFVEKNIQIDKSISIKGTILGTVESMINPGSSNDSSLIVFLNSTYPLRTNRLKINDIILTNGYANNGFSKGGGAIYGGIGTELYINGHTILIKNIAPDSTSSFVGSPNGGAIYSDGLVEIGDSVSILSNSASNGGAIYSTDRLIIKGQVSIGKGSALKDGGAIYTIGKLSCFDSVHISGLAALKGGAIYAANAEVYLNNYVLIDSSFAGQKGGAISLLNSYYEMNDSVIINGNDIGGSAGAAIYCFGNNDINITSGQITFNQSYTDTFNCKGMAIYNDSLTGTSSIIKVNNARIFNPNIDGSHRSEFYNAQAVSAFVSDSTWWGESDTSGLIYNAPSSSVAIRSWIVCEWTMNGGLPIGTATSFPVEAYFKLHYGVPIPPKMFWMLQGVYSSDSGTFTPPIAPMASTNIISSTFNVPTTSGVVNILAIVDADTFRQKPYVIGLGIFEPKTSNNNIIKLYPNPAQNILNISSNEFTGINKVNVVVKNLLGKLVLNNELAVANNEATLSLNLAPGIYIVEVVNVKGKSYAQQITIL